MSRTKPIPPEAKLVFKGVIFDVYQWEQKLYDGTTAIFEKLKRPDTVVIIATTADSIILVDEEQPNYSKRYLSIPAGRMDVGESPLEAAQRELAEETGYVSDHWELFAENQPVSKIEWTVHTYLAKLCRKEHKVSLDAGEKMETKLVSFDELLQISESPDFHEESLDEQLLRARLIPDERKKLYDVLFGA